MEKTGEEYEWYKVIRKAKVKTLMKEKEKNITDYSYL